MVSRKILIVEDDVVPALALKDFLEEDGYAVIHVVSGEEALEAYGKERPSLILLDVMLPGISGFEVIAKIRESDHILPVIMITGTEYDADSQVKGYGLGAVNYVWKPVIPQVLLAQINRLLHPPEMKRYNLNGYHITLHNQELGINDEIHTLRHWDIAVLSVLLQRQNEIITRKELLLSVWKDDAARLNNHLDSSISRIRTFLSHYPGIKIRKVYGGGYGIV
ncbi:MAG: response regulator transcription factor [Tannerella sp.]|jgi:DNA-binding response OmpR family regulator|nr:response regulator transcription factor [Tannerella sp.]